MSVWLAPEDLENFTDEDFDEMLDEIMSDLEPEAPIEEGNTQPSLIEEEKPNTTPADNLQRWIQDGKAKEFVASRGGKWNDGDWEALVKSLESTSYWPIEPDRVGEELEKATREYEWGR